MQNDQDYTTYLVNLGNAVNFYFSATVVPIGIILNIFTIFIFLRKRLRKTSNMSIFYIGLTIYDILAISNSILFIQLLPSLGIILQNYSDIACKLCQWWRRSVVYSPSFGQIIISIDRFRCVVFPQTRIQLLQDPFQLKCLLASILPILLIVDVESFWYYTISVTSPPKLVFDPVQNVSQNVSTESLSCTASPQLVNAINILNVVFRSYLPFLLMLILNIATTKKFLAMKKSTLTRSLKREYTFTLTVFGLNLTFFILYLPWTIWYILSTAFQPIAYYKQPIPAAKFTLFYNVAVSLSYLNNLSIFFVNVIFNDVFRKEMIVMLKRGQSRGDGVHFMTQTQTQTNVNDSVNKKGRFSLEN